MKKLFFILISLLWTYSIMAVETVNYTFTSSSWLATPDNWTTVKKGSQKVDEGVMVTPTESGAGAKSSIVFANVVSVTVTYTTLRSTSGSIDVQVGENEAKSNVFSARATNQTLVYNFDDPQTGAITFTVNCTAGIIYVTSISVTYNYSASAPAINAENMNLGVQIIGLEDDGYMKDTTLVIEGANLTAPIAISFIGSHLSADESTLPSSGGTLHLHVISNAALLLSDTVVLTANGVTMKVPVEGKINQNIALTGIAVTMSPGTTCYDATVDGIQAIWVGNSAEDGSLTITVPAHTTRLRFYAAAWARFEGRNAILSAPAGVELSKTSIDLLADDGISESPFILNALTPTPYTHEIILSGVTSETSITIASGTARRFVVWGAVCEVADGSGYAINYRNKEGTVIDNEIVILNLPEPPVIAGYTFLHWQVKEGKLSNGITIQAVYESNLPSGSPAAEVVNPANPAQKLIRNGNVYILSDGVEYNILGSRLR